MAHGSAVKEIKNPGPFQVPARMKTILTVCAVAGLVGFIVALILDSQRAWFSFLMNHFFYMSLALGGIFFSAVNWITNAMWSAPIRRVGESFTAYLPISVVTFAALIFGMHDLYHWTHAEEVAKDVILQHKAGYLNIPFFMIRNLIVLIALVWLTRKMIGYSLAQDQNKDVRFTLKNRFWAPVFLLVFGIGYTMAAFDQLMSLDPHWFSTMFGVYSFAGLFYSFLAAITIVTILLRRSGALAAVVNENHLHDLGKFMFAFTVFYAYIGFSQFMLIWYANLPEETLWFINRFSGGWVYLAIFLLVGKFLIPFLVLMPRDAKRNENVLLVMGVFMLFAHWVDLYWVTQPELSRLMPKFGWQEILISAGFFGVFGLSVVHFLGKHSVLAIGDPRLAESVHHHHQ